MAAMTGSTVSHYKILDRIGEGGMGVVYKALDMRLKRIVALKFLASHLLEERDSRERFIREAKASAGLHHPNICAVHEIGESEDSFFIVMPFIEGRTLRRSLTDGPLDIPVALDLVGQVGRALQAAHEKGIVHRDVKSENVMVRPRSGTDAARAILMDFGVARLAAQRARITREGSTVGTAAYMAPEQAFSSDVDHRADIWSLGVILYEALTGRLPFEADNEQAILYSIVERQPAAPSVHRPEIPAELDQVVLKCLEKKPEHRYQSAGEVAPRLFAIRQALLTGAEIEAVDEEPPRRRFLVAAGLVGLLVLLLALLVTFNRGGPARDPSLAILPLVNLSGFPDQDYLAAGVTEALINRLSALPDMRVISRASALALRDKPRSMTQIAQDLDVSYVLEGSVIRSGDRVRVNAQLVDAVADTPVWTESYERGVEDLLALQSEIAAIVAREVRLELSPDQRERLARVRQVRPAAHEAYLRGGYAFSRRSAESIREAIEFYQQAVDLEPGYAEAYAGLAAAHATLTAYSNTPASELLPLARRYGEQALAIDPDLPEALTALAGVVGPFDWNWERAETMLRRAIEQRPGDSQPHHRYFHQLTYHRRFEEARAELKAAQRLDPLWAGLNRDEGELLMFEGRMEEAVDFLDKLYKSRPDFPSTGFYLAVAAAETGHAQAVVDRSPAMSEVADPRMIAVLGRAHAFLERRQAAVEALEMLETRAAEGGVAPILCAAVHAALDEPEAALDWLDKELAQPSYMAAQIGVHPWFRSLKNEPRFQAMLTRVGVR